MSELDAVLAYIKSNLEPALERLFGLLRIRSISTDPHHARECRTCAEWHVRDLRSIGFSASARDTPGHPIVVGHDRKAQGISALFFGHYDVQPVDPLHLWTHDPFDPRVETRADGTRAIRARGASEYKGQVMAFMEACRAWKTITGRLPIPVSVLIACQEESAGISLQPFLHGYAYELRADIGLICGSTMWDRAITTMLRGLFQEQITMTAADRDLHSGFDGSAAANPNRILAHILADLHDADGRVTVPGFYNGVLELPQAVAEQRATLEFDPAAFLSAVGPVVPAGERGRSVLEMIWSRPTYDINGMGGGYQGNGFKTVIPSIASAKISFRLVFDQDPNAIRRAFRDFVRARVPADCRVDFTDYGSGHAIRFPIDPAPFRKTRDALAAEWGRNALLVGSGGSIPVTHVLKQALGMDVILVGFARGDDRSHGPDERYDLESFHRGARSWARILYALAH